MSDSSDDDELFGDIQKQLQEVSKQAGVCEPPVCEPPVVEIAEEPGDVEVLEVSPPVPKSRGRRLRGKDGAGPSRASPASPALRPVPAEPLKLSRKGAAIMRNLQSLREEVGLSPDPRFLKYCNKRKKRRGRRTASALDDSLDSSMVEGPATAESPPDVVLVFVRLGATLAKCTMRMEDPFSCVLTWLYEERDVPPSKVLMWVGKEFEGRRIEDPSTVTPRSLNWNQAEDFLSVRICETAVHQAVSRIQVKLQGEADRRHGPIPYLLLPFEPLLVAVEKYCESHGIEDPRRVVLSIDGEEIDPRLTPRESDLEHGEVLDVQVLEHAPPHDVNCGSPTRKVRMILDPSSSSSVTEDDIVALN